MLTRNLKITLMLLATAGLAGCASGPSYQEQASKILSVNPAEGRIYIYRKSALGAAVQPAIRINGEEVGKAKPKGFFYVDLTPGTYDISASTEAERNLNMTLSAGEEKYVRLEVKMGGFVGHIKPVLVDTEVGMEELQKMKYTGSDE